MPCMNLTSAGVALTFERSVACAALMVLRVLAGRARLQDAGAGGRAAAGRLARYKRRRQQQDED